MMCHIFQEVCSSKQNFCTWVCGGAGSSWTLWLKHPEEIRLRLSSVVQKMEPRWRVLERWRPEWSLSQSGSFETDLGALTHDLASTLAFLSPRLHSCRWVNCSSENTSPPLVTSSLLVFEVLLRVRTLLVTFLHVQSFGTKVWTLCLRSGPPSLTQTFIV